MLNKEKLFDQYIAILNEELVPAFGCTEPIAIAYAAAKAREQLGEFPDKISILCSGNIVKNVKGVIVPKSNNLRGISASALMGVVAGDSAKGLEVLEGATPAQVEQVHSLLAEGLCSEGLLETPAKLHLVARVEKGSRFAEVEVLHNHLNIVRIETDEGIVFQTSADPSSDEETGTDRDCLTVEDILDFATNVDIERVKPLLQRQCAYNSSISQAGLDKPYGACVGSTLLATCGNNVRVRARAYAAAGSDARMSGCELPVVINSGSGNQGITVSLPVIEYAKELGLSEEQLYRCLCVSNLVSVHQKSKIGRLSAYCGAVSAAAGAGAAIAYMHGGSLEEVSQTIVNTLANVSGIVCDGAKPSCAAKIASSVDAAIMGFDLAFCRRGFQNGEGLVKAGVEETMDGVAQMAREGMQGTDEEILSIMMRP